MLRAGTADTDRPFSPSLHRERLTLNIHFNLSSCLLNEEEACLKYSQNLTKGSGNMEDTHYVHLTSRHDLTTEEGCLKPVSVHGLNEVDVYMKYFQNQINGS